MAAPREQVVCGWHAVRAALQHRPQHLRRLLLSDARRADLALTLRHLARQRVPYRIVGPEELERASGSRAHQGVCAVFAAPQLPLASGAELRQWATERGVWLALDGVGNPHNLGAIARTAAFLGARGLWLDVGDAAPVTSTAALRTAEGALETLPVWLVDGLPAALQTLGQAGGSTAALCLQDAVSLGQWQPPRDRAIVLVAGAEELGVSAAVRRACATALRIPGTDAVESLNVGVAVGVALARWLVP